MLLEQPRSVYIHIPFCTNKCYYCDFNSYVLKGQPVEDYLDALEREMQMTVRMTPPGPVDTIFIGGGTPTVLLPHQMERLLCMIGEYFPFAPLETEVTIEANPGTTDLQKLQAMKAGGVNRLSFGVQSFSNELLKTIGRIHTTEEVYNSLDNANKAGFDNISIDLMFGLPNQTEAVLNASLDEALRFDLSHYSIYSLKVEENTLFHTMYEKDQLPLPEEEEEYRMYMLVMDRLQAAGYAQYEISNFARPGKESRHNSAYWLNNSYYGLGAGAHGYVQRHRHVNVKSVQPYIDATRTQLPRLEQFAVSAEEAMEDFMMVGLRLLSGVRRVDFRSQFGKQLEDVFGDPLRKLTGLGLLEENAEGYCLTKQGVLYGNEVFGSFVGCIV